MTRQDLIDALRILEAARVKASFDIPAWTLLLHACGYIRERQLAEFPDIRQVGA